jgi:hypothetical protein
VPILEWLEKTEKKVKDMELVPTDEEKIQQRIREHDVSVIFMNISYIRLYSIKYLNLNRYVKSDSLSQKTIFMRETEESYPVLKQTTDFFRWLKDMSPLVYVINKLNFLSTSSTDLIWIICVCRHYTRISCARSHH